MKSIARIFVVLFLFAISGFANAGWHEQSQDARNAEITTQAKHDLNLKSYPACKATKTCTVGGQCFPWVQDVVRVASMLQGLNPPIYLPLPDSTGWHLSQSANLYASGTISPSRFTQGTIIQARVHVGGVQYRPGTSDYIQHTMTISENSSANQTVTIIESNYEITNEVTTRTVGYSWFTDYHNVEYDSQGYHYSAYFVR